MFARPLRELPRGTRIAWVGDFDGYLAVEKDVLRLCESSLDVLQDLGCLVEPAVPDMPPEQVWAAFLTWRHLLTFESLRHLYESPNSRRLLKPEAVWEITRGAQLTADDTVRAHAQRSQWFEAVADLLGDYDIIAAPSAQVFPFAADIRSPQWIDGRQMDTYHRWMETVAPWSLAGLPVLNVPAGFDARGLPMGIQLIGRSHADLYVLRLGASYDRATQWVTRARPPLLDR